MCSARLPESEKTLTVFAEEENTSLAQGEVLSFSSISEKNSHKIFFSKMATTSGATIDCTKIFRPNSNHLAIVLEESPRLGYDCDRIFTGGVCRDLVQKKSPHKKTFKKNDEVVLGGECRLGGLRWPTWPTIASRKICRTTFGGEEASVVSSRDQPSFTSILEKPQ
jgi:hypothetical protein